MNGIINRQAGVSLPAALVIESLLRRDRSWSAPTCAHPMAIETPAYVVRAGFPTAAARATQRFPVHSRITRS